MLCYTIRFLVTWSGGSSKPFSEFSRLIRGGLPNGSIAGVSSKIQINNVSILDFLEIAVACEVPTHLRDQLARLLLSYGKFKLIETLIFEMKNTN